MTKNRTINPELQPRLCCQTCGEEWGDGVVRPFGAIRKGVCDVCGRVKVCHSAIYFGYLSKGWNLKQSKEYLFGGTCHAV